MNAPIRIESLAQLISVKRDVEERKNLITATFGIDAEQLAVYQRTLNTLNSLLEASDLFPRLFTPGFEIASVLRDSLERVATGFPAPSSDCPLCGATHDAVDARVYVVTLIDDAQPQRPYAVFVIAGATSTDFALDMAADYLGTSRVELERRFRVWAHPSEVR
jgi:hypothetical protein